MFYEDFDDYSPDQADGRQGETSEAERWEIEAGNEMDKAWDEIRNGLREPVC